MIQPPVQNLARALVKHLGADPSKYQEGFTELVEIAEAVDSSAPATPRLGTCDKRNNSHVGLHREKPFCKNWRSADSPSEHGDLQIILRKEGLSDWHVEWSTGGALCQISQKRILLSPTHGMAMFLHEVAHALRGPVESDPTGHDSIWADRYTSLVNSYMVTNPGVMELLSKGAEWVTEIPADSSAAPVPRLNVGDEASLWHYGTKSFYRATIIKPETPEEAIGPEMLDELASERELHDNPSATPPHVCHDCEGIVPGQSARAWILALILEERKRKRDWCRFLHSFYALGSEEQISQDTGAGSYGTAILDNFDNTIRLNEVAQWMEAYAESRLSDLKRLLTGTEDALIAAESRLSAALGLGKKLTGQILKANETIDEDMRLGRLHSFEEAFTEDDGELTIEHPEGRTAQQEALKNGMSPIKAFGNGKYHEGWQTAHDPRACGHPAACWQDRNYPQSELNYNPETRTSNPPMDYRCVICEVESRLSAARELVERELEFYKHCVSRKAIVKLLADILKKLKGEAG